MNAPPFIGETVEHGGKLYTVMDRKACGVSGWWLTLRTDNGQEFGVLDRSVKRVSPPIIDNVVPMPRRLRVVAVNGVRV